MTAHAPAAHDDHGAGHDGHDEHIHPPSFYIKTWGVLIVLLIISIVGPMAEIRALTLITAFGIAVVKAYIVCSRFMHLDIEKRYVAYFLATSIAFMVLFFFAVAPDILKHEGANWVNVGAKTEIARYDLGDDGHGGHGGQPATEGHGGGHEGASDHESEALKAGREAAAKKLEGIDAAMKAIAGDLKAAPPAEAAAPAEEAAPAAPAAP